VAANSFTQWQQPEQGPGVGTAATYGPTPVFRNEKDQQLSGWRQSSDTQYPDGYLGTMSSSRRADKTMGTLSRMNARQYSRGVHKGEKINSGDYLWPDEFNLWTALNLEAEGKKFAPPGAEPVRLTNDGKVGPRGISRDNERNESQQISLERRSRLKSLAPRWK
jgi:hypothetical protein